MEHRKTGSTETAEPRAVARSATRDSAGAQPSTRLQELMELGGWASYEMVLRYAHLATENLRAAAGRISDTNLTQRPNL